MTIYFLLWTRLAGGGQYDCPTLNTFRFCNVRVTLKGERSEAKQNQQAETVEFHKRQFVGALAWRLHVLKREHTKNHGASIFEQLERFRKDVTVLPAPGSLTCSVCNASYESITKLREHQSMSHRRGGIEERPQVAVVVEPEDPGLS